MPRRIPAHTSKTPLGAKVRKIADKMNLTMVEVAAQAKIPRQIAYRIMSGVLKSGRHFDNLMYWVERNK